MAWRRQQDPGSKPDVRERLREGAIVGDGAMGTYLYQLGVPVGVCAEELNLTRPELIRDVHRQYYNAGARLIETNTFAANRAKLDRYGLADKVAAINKAGAEIARADAGGDAYIAGAAGSARLPGASITKTEAAAVYEEQFAALLEGGVDLLLLETFEDLEDALLAVSVARKMTDRAIICQLAVESGGAPDGRPLAEAFARLREEGADVVGLNCRSGPYGIMRLLERLEDRDESGPLSVFPNAGLPAYEDGNFTYPAGPDYFGESAVALAKLGARLIGGCCGTTPAHIAAAAKALEAFRPAAPQEAEGKPTARETAESAKTAANNASEAAERKEAERKEAERKAAGAADTAEAAGREEAERKAAGTAKAAAAAEAAESKTAGNAGAAAREAAEIGEPPRGEPTILDLVRERHTVIVELDPPRDLNIDKFMKGARALQEAGADAITMADNSLAMTRVSNAALAFLVKERLGARPLVHIACRDRNLIGTQSHLMGLHAVGVDHVLAITGDPARFGDLPGASSVYDMTSFEMIRMIKQLNEGVAFSGKRLKERTRFIVGTALNPNVKYLHKAIERLEKKVEAGADFAMTQPVYDPELIERLHEATKHLPIPIFVGIMPFTSGRNAEYLHNEVPGITLSDDVRQRMAGLEGEEGRRVSLEISRELIDAAMGRFNGIYLITPFMAYGMTVELTRYAAERAGRAVPGLSAMGK